MKKHFGYIEDWGDYENPIFGCEQTICGETGGAPTENATENWDLVTCKKCLKIREKRIEILIKNSYIEKS